jgi:hypothetical protein
MGLVALAATRRRAAAGGVGGRITDFRFQITDCRPTAAKASASAKAMADEMASVMRKAYDLYVKSLDGLNAEDNPRSHLINIRSGAKKNKNRKNR